MELSTREALVRWMEHEGLSPFTLLKIAPKPTAAGRKLPATVVMEWGVEDLEYAGDREKFLAWQLTAEEVTLFRCEGTLDRFEECSVELGDDDDGIDLRLETGGKLRLRCARLIVGKSVQRLRKGQPRPHHGEVNLELDLSRATLGDVRGWLGIPGELACRRHRTHEPLSDDSSARDAGVATIVDDAGHDLIWLSIAANRFTASRGKWAADELWETLWSSVTAIANVTKIHSRNLVCPPATWPARPPRKPVPLVWPDVYGVTCDFEQLTLADLRRCLGLANACPFVFDDANPTEPHDALTLAEAARKAGRTSASGVFHSEEGKALLQCVGNLKEGALSFRRQRGCDAATWLAVWHAPENLPGVKGRYSRTTRSPPDPWPSEPPA